MSGRQTGVKKVRGLRMRCLAGLLSLMVAVPGADGRAADAGFSGDGGEEPAQASRPKYDVKGAGLVGNLKMRRMLGLLESEEEPLLTIDAVFVEDSIVLLQSALERDGFLAPSGVAQVFDGKRLVGGYGWRSGNLPLLPRGLSGDKVVFRLEKGRRHVFNSIEFSGLTALSAEEAEQFFVGKSFLFDRNSARRFTPGGFKSGIKNLTEQLVRVGFADNSVSIADKEVDSESGLVNVRITVEEGSYHLVGSVTPPDEMPEVVAGDIREACAGAAGATWSPFWQESFLQEVRGILYEEGFPTARVLASTMTKEARGAEIAVDLELAVEPGTRVKVGEVTFSGEERTRRSLLNRSVGFETGDWYRRSDVEQTRSQISSLGVFSSVRPRIAEQETDLWNVNYEIVPNKRLEVGLLAGYGSYERLRGGLEVFHANVLGRAHRGRLEVIVSTKSTSAEYNYTVPRIFGTAADATTQVYGLDREEVSFQRRDYGLSVGARRNDLVWGFDGTMRYKFEKLTADTGDQPVFSSTPSTTRVGAVTFDFVRDIRDNPISPHSGASYAFTFETAARAIGGNVDFQKAEFRGSWHIGVGRDTTFRAGLRHGVIFPLRSGDEVPLGRRYFPGGENTIRGYKEGTAAPADDEGTFVGAEVATITNLELDLALTQSLYVLTFTDVGLTGLDITDYPGDEIRVSLGVGVRYYTAIGPVRLEYGHNVVKQTGDQNGQLHFSLGFPF